MNISKTVIDRVVEEMLANVQEMDDIVVAPNMFEVYLAPEDHAEIQNLFNILREQGEKRLDKELAKHSASDGRFGLPSVVGKLLGLDLGGGKKTYRRTENFWVINFNRSSEKISVNNAVFEVKKGQVGIIAQFSSPDSMSLESQFKTVFTIYSDDDIQRTAIEKLPAADPNPDDEFATRLDASSPHQAPAVLKYTAGGSLHTFSILKNVVSVGRRTTGSDVDLALDCSEKISRKHLEIRYDREQKKYFLKSFGIYGTTVNGKKTPDSLRTIEGSTQDLNLEVELAETTRIALAGGDVILDFEMETIL